MDPNPSQYRAGFVNLCNTISPRSFLVRHDNSFNTFHMHKNKEETS